MPEPKKKVFFYQKRTKTVQSKRSVKNEDFRFIGRIIQFFVLMKEKNVFLNEWQIDKRESD